MSTLRQVDFRYAPTSRWTAICRPDDSHKSVVREDGALLYDFQKSNFGARSFGRPAFSFGRVFEFGIQTDHLPLEITQRIEDARTPIVITTVRYPQATFELRAAGHLHDGDRRTDIVLWTISAAKDVTTVFTGLHIDAYERGRVFVGRSLAPDREVFAVDVSSLTPHEGQEAFSSPPAKGDSSPFSGPVALVSAPHSLQTADATGFRPVSGLMGVPQLLRAGETMGGALFFPLNHEESGAFGLDWAHAALEVERTFWNGYNLQPLAMQIPDRGVMDLLTACARNIVQAREMKEGLLEFQVGPTVYRGLYTVDAHFLLEAAQYLGHEEAALQGIRVLQRRATPDGAIEILRNHHKETAIALATLVRQCELTRDTEHLVALWPLIRRAVGHIQSLREASTARGPDAPEYGLMPPAFSDGGLAGLRPEYTTALWTLAGLKAVAGAAERLGQQEDAQDFRATFAGLLRAFRAHAERDMRTLADGTPYLPMLKPGSGQHHRRADYPGEPEPWHRVNPGTATWALAHAIYPGEVFPPEDPLVQHFCRLLDRIDDEEGIPANTGWLPLEAVWTYAASFYAHVWLYAGRPDKAIDYLYAFANHAAPTLVWREEQAFVHSGHRQKIGDMPHNWASAEFIRLVRHLLVFERGDTLEFFPGLPQEWCVPGQPLRLARTPTRFGPVDLRLQVDHDGQGRIDIALDTGWSRRPSRRLLHLPGDEGVGSQAITINGASVVARGDGVIDLPDDGRIVVIWHMPKSHV